uniref:Uncharacterized protein n=1 Tax=Anguilla anguilla TaxID=7936 RepID=A0A0E9S6T4_ANGAN
MLNWKIVIIYLFANHFENHFHGSGSKCVWPVCCT